MREFWKKTSLLYKLIAVMLTVVMVGTSLYFHFDRKYSAKALTNEDWVNSVEIKKMVLKESGNVANLEDWNEVAEDVNLAIDGSKTYAFFVYTPKDGWDELHYNFTSVVNLSIESRTWEGENSFIFKIDTEISGNKTLYLINISVNGVGTVDLNKSASFNAYTPAELNVTAKIGENSFTGALTCGKGSQLEVTVTSGWDIQSLKVLDKTLTSDELSNTLTVDSANHTNKVTYIYKFDDETSNTNKNYTDLSIIATDSNSDSEKNNKTMACTSLLYDQTAPVISATVGGEALDSDKWYNTDDITFTVTSGGITDETNIDGVIAAVNGVEVLTNDNGNDAYIIDNNNGTYTIKRVPGGTNTIVVTATDIAGNSNTGDGGTFAFKVDKDNPSISSLNVEGITSDGYVKLNNSNDVGISGAAADTTSGVATLHVTGTKDGANISPVDITADSVASGTYNYSFNLSDILNPNGTLSGGTYDGAYTLSIRPYDAAGNEGSTTISRDFTLDTIKPVVQKVALQKLDGTEWQNVPDSDLSNGNCYVNATINPKVRFKLALTEVNPSTNPIVAYSGTDVFNDCMITSETVGTETYYYIEIASDKLSTTVPLTINAKSTDKAGNVSDDLELTPLLLVDSDIKVNLTSLIIGGNAISKENVTDISALIENNNVKGQVTIKVKAVSGFDINTIKLTGTMPDSSAYEKTFTKADGTITNTTETNGIHTTDEVVFALPEVLTNNIKISSLNLYIKDDNGQEKTVPIGDLLYDRTNPEMTITNSDYSNTKWFQEYRLEYNLISGTSAIESDLNTVSYTINGTVNNVAVTGTKLENAKTGDIPESTSTAGTTVTFAAQDKATNSLNGGVFVVKVDKTAPSVAPLTVNGEAVDADTILAGAPQLTSTVTDNLTINNYHVSVLYNGAAYADYPVLVQKDETSESINYTLQQLLGDKTLNDGRYDVSVIAWDKSGRDSNVSSTAFVVDNTAPVLTADIVGGTSGKSNGFYNTDVTVRLTCKDNNFNPAAMVVTDNGNVVNADWKVGTDVYYADIVLSSEGMHNIIVSGNDKAGNAAVPKQATFAIDKTTPAVTLLVNGGQVYNESRGTLNLTGPLTLTASVSDTNEDAGDLQIQVIKTVPDTATTTSAFMPTSERTFSFAEEADYTINIFAVDKANNQGTTRTISFRVDTNAPQLTITGANGGTSASATTVSFNLNEAFWSDAKGTVEIYRKAGDGVDEVLFKTLTLTPTQKNYSLSEVLTETGIYRFEFTANDKVGHTATTSQKVTVDRNKPEITLSGVKNYDSTDGEVSISAIIKDEFYANKKVSISGTRLGADGKKVQLSFSPFAATANPTTISDTFKEEGIYDITITSTDIAGNVSTSSVHFTIDTSKPNIGDLSDFDGKTFNKKTFNELNLDELELDNLVSDLTVCQIRMYLNGSEYDGIDEIEDGSYTLLITAEDELGHKSEKTATFVIDTKDPVFIVTGVEDGEVKNEDYNIEVSLQLDEDKLEQVTLNGKDITLKNNEASLNVTEKGEYELYMKATDEAGNEAEQTITFTFGEESVASAVSDAVEKAASHWWMWAILVAAILAVGGFIFIILKRRKED
ncbi:MAG: hypothetical protein IJT72_10570 [Lachnospiraceae bacterium]|nr:hypothetical protein [Lachnospiraceae bacterium]